MGNYTSLCERRRVTFRNKAPPSLQEEEENTLTRFIRAKEQRDERSNERLQKLKEMIAKRVRHEKRAREQELETIQEREERN